ncbi:hypothetical protein LPJ61_005379 [Coemansia biformis]|uniref:Uncharacterized protein n=1 Tax=Coemansia biformis TaxID=1286918 RepID=A0A9W7Y369_9FUNG|nr:hypothetical protein LPJ61_005379 [Coemansia biformis]
MCGLVEDFSLVGFSTLCITDKRSVALLLKEVDKANGYIFGALTAGNESILLAADATDMLTEARDAQERYGILRGSAGSDSRGPTAGAGTGPSAALAARLHQLRVVEHE